MTQMEFSGIDIDHYAGRGVAADQRYRFVRIVDLYGRDDPPQAGADINGIAALSSVPLRSRESRSGRSKNIHHEVHEDHEAHVTGLTTLTMVWTFRLCHQSSVRGFMASNI